MLTIIGKDYAGGKNRKIVATQEISFEFKIMKLLCNIHHEAWQESWFSSWK